MPDLTVAQFARREGVHPRQVRRWLAAGMPATGTPPRIDPRAARRWLRSHLADRQQGQDETRQALEARIEDVQAMLAELLAAHVSTPVVDRLWQAEASRASAALRGWPASAAPPVTAWLLGVEAPPIDGAVRDPASRAFAAQVPAPRIVIALAVATLAREILTTLAAAPAALDPEIDRLDAASRHGWLAPPDFSTPRPRLAAWGARLDRLRRDIHAGRWQPLVRVEARLVERVVATRQHLLDRAPSEVLALRPEPDEAAVRLALGRAVESALEELAAA